MRIQVYQTGSMKMSVRVITALLLIFQAHVVFSQASPITLKVDASEAPRQILHASLGIPVRPGPLTLLYPKWIPGEHGPTGPITDLVNLRMKAADKTIEWRRDPEEMYAFN